jgi:hypothetical protein
MNLTLNPLLQVWLDGFKIKRGLQVQPKPGRICKVPGEAQSDFSRHSPPLMEADAPLAVDP